jgi:hypothetical protein
MVFLIDTIVYWNHVPVKKNDECWQDIDEPAAPLPAEKLWLLPKNV